ncbi:MAG: tRNA pseudouridine(38-40) synthase TruA [Anaerolineae bacterium]|nr:tRNA pseudouridine(38-40) synthase TruA [Anaerolineae bacterium]
MTGERRYRAIIEYDGTDFLGFQIQAQGRTVQGEIEKSLQQVTRAAIRIDGAGRTDTGVHATGQVIAFNTTWRHPLAELHRALNATLPDDIVVSDLKIVDLTFHPRFSALSRSYSYAVMNQPWVSVLRRRYAYHVRKPLDVGAMNEASQYLIGSHDFTSFGKPPYGDNTVREVSRAEWFATGSLLTFEITANAFLYRMVRTIVGTLVQVGLGQLAANEIKSILEARDLMRSAPPAPPHGLCLVRVTYPAEA